MSDEALNDAPASESRRPRARVNPDVKRQRLNPLDGDENGVKVVFDGRDTYDVRFGYNPALVAQMHKIDGAQFDRNADAWKVPVSQYDALGDAVARMRSEFLLDIASRGDIERLAGAVAVERQQAAGIESAPPARLSDFHQVGEPQRGEIISVNDRYAAQLTGFGRRDGIAFVTLHRLSELGDQVFKGDKVSITYGEKGRAVVSQMQTLEEKLDASLGRSVDGVTVVQDGDKYKISFDFNPTLSDRIQRVDGAHFDRKENVHVADVNLKTFVARAVNDMRKEYVADRADRDQMESIANERIDGVKVHDAYVSDGKAYSGRVLAANDRYVLQHNGKDHVALHRVRNLNEAPEVGHNARIVYQNGRGRVNEPQQDRSKSQGLSR